MENFTVQEVKFLRYINENLSQKGYFNRKDDLLVTINDNLRMICPDCGQEIIPDSGCAYCPFCGWSKCS